MQAYGDIRYMLYKMDSTQVVSEFIFGEDADKVIGQRIARRPVFRAFLAWYTDTYKDDVHGWGKSMFREELKTYDPFKNDNWQDLKLRNIDP